MPSIPPSASNDYNVPSDWQLIRANLNAVFSSIAQRLRALEAVEADFQELIDQGTGQALEAIAANIGPQITAMQALLQGLETQITAAEDAVAVLLAGNLPAGNVTFTPTGSIAATTVQAAIVEVAADAAAALASATAALPSKGTTIALALALG